MARSLWIAALTLSACATEQQAVLTSRSSDALNDARAMVDRQVELVEAELAAHRIAAAASRGTAAASLLAKLEGVSRADFVARLSAVELEELRDYVTTRTAHLRLPLDELTAAMTSAPPGGPSATTPAVDCSTRCSMCLGLHRKCCYGNQPGNGFCVGVWTCPSQPGDACVQSSCPCAGE